MKHRGFTLVELIVSLGLFAFIMSIATGAYLIMIATNRQAQVVSTGINNLSYALDAMARNIRTGTNYSCPDSKTFSFTDAYGVPTVYAFTSTNNSRLTMSANGVTTDITDTTVVLSADSMFLCRGELKSDDIQSNVVITVSGTVVSGPGKTVEFNIQTMATRRGVDL